MIKNIIFPIEFDHFTGGMIHSAAALAKHLTDEYNVYFLAYKEAEVFKLDSKINNLVLRNPYTVSFSSPFKTICTYFEVKKLLKPFDSNDTIIFTNNVGSELIFSGFGLSPIPFRRVFVSRGGDYLGKTGWVLKKGFNNVFGFVCTSRRQFDILRAIGINQGLITLIHDGVESLKKNYKYTFNPKEVIQLSVVGYINNEKNQKLIIEALNVLKRENSFRYCLNIYGTDTTKSNIYTKDLKSLIDVYGLNDNVVFHGFEKDKNLIYINTHILISSSLSEGFGRTVAEAMSYGIPTIGLKESGGLLDIITENVDGILINNNKYELSNAILKVCKNDDFRKSLSENAKKTYSEKFTEYIMCQNYKNYLRLIF